MLDQAVILAGGLGTRLGHRTQQMPKPLLEVGSRPFLEYLIWNLERHGIRDIVLLVGHLADAIEDRLGDGSRYGVSLSYSREEGPLGTGGALKLARDMLRPEFLLINGDTLFDINFWDFYGAFMEAGTLGAMALSRVEDVSRYGAIKIDAHRVVGFVEKGSEGAGFINAGTYLFQREVVEMLPPGSSSLEKDLLPRLVATGSLAAATYEGFFIDIGIPMDLERADKELPRWRRKPAVFLDRDGVLNVDHGYVHSREEFEWVTGAIEAVKLLNDAGLLVFVVTNQAGIARGHYTEEQFLAFMRWFQMELQLHGAHVDRVYHCPHHPEAGQGEYTRSCSCRKPNPGMLEYAMEEWEIDGSRSFLVGDKDSDVAAAKKAGIAGYKFTGTDVLGFVRAILDQRD